MTETAKADEGNEVKMTDGRLVEFAGKRRMLKTVLLDNGQAQVRFDFANGETRFFTVPPAMLNQFAAHGASQKIGDTVAGMKGEGGTQVDLEDMVLQIDDAIDNLYNGNWSVEREGSGLAGTSVLMRALVEVTGLDAGTVKDKLKDMTHKEKLALRDSKKLRSIVERLENERRAKRNDESVANKLLAGFSQGNTVESESVE